MAFYLVYLLAIIVIILHYTGWLRRHNLEWIIFVMAIAIFPAMLFL